MHQLVPKSKYCFGQEAYLVNEYTVQYKVLGEMKNNWEAYYKGSIYFKYKKHLQILKKQTKDLNLQFAVKQ